MKNVLNPLLKRCVWVCGFLRTHFQKLVFCWQDQLFILDQLMYNPPPIHPQSHYNTQPLHKQGCNIFVVVPFSYFQVFSTQYLIFQQISLYFQHPFFRRSRNLPKKNTNWSLDMVKETNFYCSNTTIGFNTPF